MENGSSEEGSDNRCYKLPPCVATKQRDVDTKKVKNHTSPRFFNSNNYIVSTRCLIINFAHLIFKSSCSNYVIHASPKYIELDGYILKDIFIKRNNFTPEALDIAIRRIGQLDYCMYINLFPAYKQKMVYDFFKIMQMDVLTNKDPLKSVSIIDQFTMRFNDYDISECRMVLLPCNS
jgi:hypothetical protein